jgi:osmotically-inducible protein OsmY
MFVLSTFAATLAATLAWPRPAEAVADEQVWAPVRQPPRADPIAGDSRLELKVTESLTKDVQVGTSNIGVTAHDCVVTLWGPISSEALSRRAEAIVRGVEGVADVTNELHVTSPAERRELAPQPIFQRLPETNPDAPKASPAPQKAVIATTAAPRAETPVWGPRPALPVSDVARQTALKPAVVLLAPVPAATVPDALPGLVDRALRANERFGRVRAEISGGVVRLRGMVPAAEDILAAARSISQLPGVERVILDGLHSPDSDSDR